MSRIIKTYKNSTISCSNPTKNRIFIIIKKIVRREDYTSVDGMLNRFCDFMESITNILKILIYMKNYGQIKKLLDLVDENPDSGVKESLMKLDDELADLSYSKLRKQ